MERRAGIVILLVAIVAGLCSGQDCAFPTSDQLGEVISSILPDGDNPQAPNVTVMDFGLVCLAYGQQRDTLRFVSAIVEYTCSGNGNCPNGTATEQIESECIAGEWSSDVQGSAENTRSTEPEASFTTTARENCSFCLSPERVSSLPTTTDSVTHCVACDSSCDKGLMRCYGVGSVQCCNFYNNSVCVDECPNPFVPNSDNVCGCPVGRFGDNCEGIVVCNATDLGTLENGMVTATNTTFDSVATYSCNTGYALTGDAMRRCQGDGTWSGDIPTCELVDCGPLEDPDNGRVNVSETVLDSVATYFCDTGYTLTGDAMRTCQRNRDWSGSEPTCTACSVPNCASCDDSGTCKICLPNFELSENVCKCPFKGCSVCDKDGTKCNECENGGRFDEAQAACVSGGDDGGDDKEGGGLSAGAIAGIIIALIVFAIILAILIALISYFAKRHWDKVHLKKTTLETPQGDFHDNQLYVTPDELDDVDRGATTPGDDGISPSNGAPDSNGSE